MVRRRLASCTAFLVVALCAAAPASSQPGQGGERTIFSSEGVPLSTTLPTPPSLYPAPPLGPVVTIDLWCCGADPLFWSVNTDFFWATAFDTNDIVATHVVTEVLWFADGGEDEQYWIAQDNGAGLPDPTTAVFLGSQSVPPSGGMWQSFDASAAGATVDPGLVYWFIRAAPGQGFDMTWQSTVNPAPPVVDPVAITMDFNGVWFKWVTGQGWHMEYEIRGVPEIIPVEVIEFEVE